MSYLQVVARPCAFIARHFNRATRRVRRSSSRIIALTIRPQPSAMANDNMNEMATSSLMPIVIDDKTENVQPEAIKKESGCSEMQAIINMILTAVGVGLLALPRAVAQSGWIGAAVLIVVSVALAHFTVWMIYSCMQTDPQHIISYQDIGQRCYGRFGYYLVAIPLFLDLLAVCAMLMILVGSGMATMAPHFDQQMWMLFYAVLMLPLTWLPGMKEIGFVSAIGLVAAAVVSVTIVFAGIAEATREHNGHVHALGPTSATALGLSFRYDDLFK